MCPHPDQAVKILSCCCFVVPPLPPTPWSTLHGPYTFQAVLEVQSIGRALGSFMCPQYAPLQTRIGWVCRSVHPFTCCRRQGNSQVWGYSAAENICVYVSVKILFRLGKQGYMTGRYIFNVMKQLNLSRETNIIGIGFCMNCEA